MPRGIQQVNGLSRYGNCITEVVIEIPRCFSISIQSDLACWLEPRPLPYRRSGSPVRRAALFGNGGFTGIGVRDDGESSSLETSRANSLGDMVFRFYG